MNWDAARKLRAGMEARISAAAQNHDRYAAAEAVFNDFIPEEIEALALYGLIGEIGHEYNKQRQQVLGKAKPVRIGKSWRKAHTGRLGPLELPAPYLGKNFADCTLEEVDYIAARYHGLSLDIVAKADWYGRVANEMRAHGAEFVRDLPKRVQQELSRAAS